MAASALIVLTPWLDDFEDLTEAMDIVAAVQANLGGSGKSLPSKSNGRARTHRC